MKDELKFLLRLVYTLFLMLGVLAMENEATAHETFLRALDSGLASPTGGYRWRDIADQLYGEGYQSSYRYTAANVRICYHNTGKSLKGKLIASNLKPNFAYQLKLVGLPGTVANERIGLSGRWWQEEWNGSAWVKGQNLNNKGDGSSPNPNDEVYLSGRNMPDSTSPTGLKYRFTGYLVFDYFISRDDGSAILDFDASSSFHVIWKTSQRGAVSGDGSVKSSRFTADPSRSPAYDTSYASQTIGLFGEWERLPAGGIYLDPGYYEAQLVLTEESFHGSGGSLAGNWAAAMAADIQFSIRVFEFVYEDMENGSKKRVRRWAPYDDMLDGEVTTKDFDVARQSRVIEIKGFGWEVAYVLTGNIGSEWRNPSQLVMGWRMKCTEPLLVYVDVNTTAGHRYLYYEPIDYDALGSGEYVQHGLGSDVTDGQWHTFVRDLQADLDEAQPGVAILRINALFFVRFYPELLDMPVRGRF